MRWIQRMLVNTIAPFAYELLKDTRRLTEISTDAQIHCLGNLLPSFYKIVTLQLSRHNATMKYRCRQYQR